MRRVDAGGAGLHTQARTLNSRNNSPHLLIPTAAAASVSGCKLVFIKAAPPNHIQVRCKL
jgi:hypothetical protein